MINNKNSFATANLLPKTAGRKRSYALPQNIEGFKSLNSDRHCYWLGFIAADGYIGKDYNRNMLRVKLKSSDVFLLENLKQGLKTDAPIVSYDKDVSRQITINSPQLISNLAFWGY